MLKGGCEAGVPAARLHPVLRRYPLRRLRLPVGGRILSVVAPDAPHWRRDPAWTQRVALGAEPPHWLKVWPASLAIARTIARAGSLRGVRVLDLGCGLGVPGITAASLEAAVCFADREPDALAFACWNAQVHCRGGTPSGQLLDWSRATVRGAYDIVLLADVTYHRSHHGPVRRQLDGAVDEHGCVLHADPVREESGRFLDSLPGVFAIHSWTCETDLQGLSVPIRLTLAARTEAALSRWVTRLGASRASGAAR